MSQARTFKTDPLHSSQQKLPKLHADVSKLSTENWRDLLFLEFRWKIKTNSSHIDFETAERMALEAIEKAKDSAKGRKYLIEMRAANSYLERCYGKSKCFMDNELRHILRANFAWSESYLYPTIHNLTLGINTNMQIMAPYLQEVIQSMEVETPTQVTSLLNLLKHPRYQDDCVRMLHILQARGLVAENDDHSFTLLLPKDAAITFLIDELNQTGGFGSKG